MKNPPRVSIVIVNWKTRELLGRCLQSIANDEQSQSFEILVVDNHSGDGSVEMVKSRFPHVVLIENKDNVGFSRGCNQAIARATGEHILLLNPDTVVIENAVSKMADFLDARAQYGAVGPRVLN